MTTLASVQTILKNNLDISSDVATAEVTLAELAIDSLALIEIMFDVEEHFKITVPTEPTIGHGQMETVGDLVAYIDRLVAEQCFLPASCEQTS